jgi:surface carbohydrate biosynthesis protein
MSDKPKNFILLVEIVDRELPASVLLGTELAGRGHNVWIVEKTRFRKSPTFFPPSIVLEKGLSKGCLPIFRSIRRAGHVLAVMCQEGFIYRSAEDYINRRVCAETIKNVDYLLLWGERQRKDLERFLGNVRGHFVTGNPRVDLLHSRLRTSWAAQGEEIRRKLGDFVLFTSRFGSVNHFRRTLDQTLDRRKTQYTGGAEHTVQERLDIRRRLFCDYMKIIRDTAARFPAKKFVVRPHPMEAVEVWTSHFEHVSNVEVCHGGASAPWLSAALCVIHNACTTGIEAYLLNKPVIEYHPANIPRSDFDPTLPGQVTGACDNLETLAQWIEVNASPEASPERNPAIEQLIAHHLKNYSQPEAYMEIANAMENFRAPPYWFRIFNRIPRIPRQPSPQQRRKRYINFEEVNELSRSYVACQVRDHFIPALVDEIGIKLQ